MDRLLSEIRIRFSKLGIVVNNAGVQSLKRLRPHNRRRLEGLFPRNVARRAKVGASEIERTKNEAGYYSCKCQRQRRSAAWTNLSTWRGSLRSSRVPPPISSPDRPSRWMADCLQNLTGLTSRFQGG